MEHCELSERRLILCMLTWCKIIYPQCKIQSCILEAKILASHQLHFLTVTAVVLNLTCAVSGGQVDDDSFIRVSPLLNLLAQLPHERLMVGNIGENGGKPNRDYEDSWSLTKEEWGRDRMPMWTNGGSGYVISMVRIIILAT